MNYSPGLRIHVVVTPQGSYESLALQPKLLSEHTCKILNSKGPPIDCRRKRHVSIRRRKHLRRALHVFVNAPPGTSIFSHTISVLSRFCVVLTGPYDAVQISYAYDDIHLLQNIINVSICIHWLHLQLGEEPVHFVQHQDRLNSSIHCKSKHCNCLSADSFANIHNKKSPIAHAHRRFNFSSEVNMPRRVNQVYYKMMFIVSDFLLVKENS
mmetsp:Transcript_38751/g.153091  ORF Transcript_38751/g.153091 Transcript_38751/m.153091 type:complete len:211 (-) Transcript_38751:467-1099(-)